MLSDVKIQRLRWKYNAKDDLLPMSFTSSPYIMLGKQEYFCHQGKDYNKGKKDKYTEKKKRCFKARSCLYKKQKARSTQQTFVGLEVVLKKSSRHVLKTSSTRLQRNNFTSSETSWRCLEDMSWKLLEDMSWRCLEDMSWRRPEDIMETNKILTGDICIFIWG